MPLQTDYRPSSFDEIVGSTETINAVKALLEREDRNHVVLLSGGSGCGKTTLAYIISEALGVYDFATNNNPNFREYNSSDFRGIDMVRGVRAESNKNPLSGSIRVFFFDECHKLTGEAQEAFLALLEKSNETPNYYIFATTNPEMLKPTFKRRCAHFELQPITEDEIIEHLDAVVTSEEKEVPKEVLEQIAQDSTGSLGIALGILDSVIGLSAKEMLKVAEQQASVQNAVIDLCRALAKGEKWIKVAAILKNLQGTEEPEGIRRKVLGYCSNWLLKEDNGRAFIILDAFSESIFYVGFPGVVKACYMALNAE